MHENPLRQKGNLAETAGDYPHSSFGFYETGELSAYIVTSYRGVNILNVNFVTQSPLRETLLGPRDAFGIIPIAKNSRIFLLASGRKT